MDNSLSLSVEIPDANSQKWYTIGELCSICGITDRTWRVFLSSDIKNEYRYEKSIPTKTDFFSVPEKWIECTKEEYQEWAKNNERKLISDVYYRKVCRNQSHKEFFKQHSEWSYNLGYKETKFNHTNTAKSPKVLYSENVLKTLKQYQMRNSVPNALKDKETAITGNVSFVQNQTVKATIDNLLDNPDTLNMLLTESLARNKALGIENMQLKEVVAIQKPKVEVYDAICDSSTLQDLQTVAITIGLKNIFKVLLADEILEEKYTNDDQHYYKPKAEYSQYLVLKDGKPWKDENGNIKVRPRVFVTGKGLNWLTRKYQLKESK